MLFMIIARDKPGALATRLENRPRHLAYMQGEAARIRLAGPILSDDEPAQPIGSVLIIEAADRAEAEAFAAQDPYMLAGLFGAVEIKPWRETLGTWLPETKT
ncbi:MAG: YciI family protein [Sphingomonadales bacterium]